jgi:hypothetical protein
MLLFLLVLFLVESILLVDLVIDWLDHFFNWNL